MKRSTKNVNLITSPLITCAHLDSVTHLHFTIIIYLFQNVFKLSGYKSLHYMYIFFTLSNYTNNKKKSIK